MNAAPTRSERRFARLNDPRFDRYRTRPWRRRLVVAMVGMIALEGVTLGIGEALHGPVYAVAGFLALFLLVAAFCLCLGILKATTRGVEELADDQLDERQLQVRGEVYARAYKIGAGLVFALLIVLMVGRNLGLAASDALGSALFVVVVHVALALPTLVAAWHERV